MINQKRVKKHISISEEAIKYIREYAQKHDLDFSHAIENLALLSLKEAKMNAEMQLMRLTIRKEMAAQYNRFAKFVAHTAIEAGAAKQAAETIYWMLLKDESIEYFKREKEPTAAGLAGRFGVNPKSSEGAVLIDLFKQKKEQFRARSVKSLRTPIEEYREFIDLIDSFVEDEIIEDPRPDFK